MTAEEKIEAIEKELAGVHAYGMTEMELKIRDIIKEQKATPEEKKWAKRNVELLEFADFDD